MKILVISDTHGDITKAEEVIRKNNNIDLIIHLGDYFRDAQKLAADFPGIPMEYVYGNSDFMVGDVPAEKLLEYNGRRIFITHGHRYSVKWDYDKLYRKAEEMNADLLLFGHTHVADMVEQNGRYLVNPGSISDSRGDTDESYAIVEINGGYVKPVLHSI
jgi:putative phosphoesterase